ncbi:MAG: leucine-rich repeat protein [Bacteroidales bacterium]|jgi:hypothetical protein
MYGGNEGCRSKALKNNHLNKGKQINYLSKNVNLSFVARPRAKSKLRIANLFAILLSILLLGFGAPRAQAQDLTVTITKTDNTSTTVTGAASLEGAVGATPLGEVAKLEISAGDFVTADWNYLKDNRTYFDSLTHFTITDGVTTVEDIPDAGWNDPLFGNQIIEVSVAKVDKIGNYAFRTCTALSTVSFPQVTCIGAYVFNGCAALTTANFPQVTYFDSGVFRDCVAITGLVLGATPPFIGSSDMFLSCPDTRYLHLVNASGEPLTGQDLDDALAAYKAAGDGNIYDDLWYGWIIESTYPIIINTANNGTVTCKYHYVPANTTVRLTVTPDAGYMLQDLTCDKQGGGEIDIDMSNHTFTMPARGVIVNATFKPNELKVIVNNETTAKTGTSLENALDAVDLSGITSLTITEGAFFATDWNWLKTNRADLSALTHFTIADGVGSVADIPNTAETEPYFGSQIEELSVTKVASIGKYAFSGSTSLTNVNFPSAIDINLGAFSGCTVLGTASFSMVENIGGYVFDGCAALKSVSFPQLKSIYVFTFKGCIALTNMKLGATPPSVPNAQTFEDCPNPRFLIPVNVSGAPLTGQDLTTALGNYRAVNDGNTGDNLWYGWVAEPTYPIIINTSSNGTVSSSYDYARANTTVKLTAVPDEGYKLQSLSCAKQGGGEVTIDMNSHTFTMPNDGVTVSAAFVPNLLVTVNGSIAKSGTSLENALSGVTLSEITSLTITGGPFFASDWYWLRTNRADLSALTHFTITDGASSVEDIPHTENDYPYWGNPYFGNPYFGRQIIELNVAKVANIGYNAFEGCTALTTVSFPQVTTIYNKAFFGCTALTAASFPQVANIDWNTFSGCYSLTNIMLGATPPTNVGGGIFNGCPGNRFLIPVNEDGVPLTNSDLTAALNAYKAVEDGDTGDELWYGCKLGETLYPIEINIVDNGVVSAPLYAPADTAVRLIITPKVGYMLKSLSCSKQGEGGVDIDTNNYTFTMPAEGVTVSATFEQNVLQVFVNNESTVRIGTSLESALSGVTLGEITSLTITGGSFLATDWYWLRAKRADLKALMYFTITGGISSVADIPCTYDNPYFGGQIKEVSVAKVAKIGDWAFSGCYTITAASFPQATYIGTSAFQSLHALTNIMLGATPPSGGNAFAYCAEERFLVPVNADGVPLTNSDLTAALNAYKAIDDGNTNDSLWYGWKLVETLYPIIINSTDNGMVSTSHRYAPANTTVKLTPTPYVGYVLQSLSCDKQGGGGVDINMGNSFTMPNEGVIVNATFVSNVLYLTVNDSIAKSGTSLESALDGVTLGEITSLTITGGPFLVRDWNWLKANRDTLIALTHFTITDSASLVADIPSVLWLDAYFGGQIKEVSVAKVTNIGRLAFSGRTALSSVSFPQTTNIDYGAFDSCTALTTANFPQVTSIGSIAFHGCTALSNLMLGVAPPSVVGDAFNGCPKDRFLIPVNADGVPLTGPDLANALASYKDIDDGDPNDNLWYGWKLEETLYSIAVDPVSNGTVGAPQYAPVNAVVRLIVIPDEGYILHSLDCAKQGGGEVDINMNTYTFIMPNEDVTINANFAPNLLVTVNDLSYKFGSSLENALDGVALDQITSLTVTGGPFLASDWNWLKGNRDIFTALTHFTVTDGTSSVADIPCTHEGEPYFGEQIIELSVAKVVNIGDFAFGGCTALSSASFPLVTDIGSSVFSGCTALSTVSFPLVTDIGSSAFSGCIALSSASFPQVANIGDNAFANCTAIINLMPGATPPNVADANAFENCPDIRFLIPVDADGMSLTGADLTAALDAYKATNDGNTSDNLWYGWELEETLYPIEINITGNGTVNSSYRYAPADATVSLTFTPDAGYILQSLSYTEKSVGEAITIDIGSPTFTMPNDSVTVNATFVTNLLVTVNGSSDKSGTSLENALDGVALDQITSLTITGGAFLASDWSWLRSKRADLGALTHFTITDGIGSVADIPDVEWGGDPYFGEQIIEVSVAKVASIGWRAFNNCATLTTANFPQVTSIGSDAFNGCAALTIANFPQVTSIGNGVFNGCAALTTANFPQVMSIGTGVFNGCAALTIANFPWVTSIGDGLFNGCAALTTANFPWVTSIGSGAFYGCAALTTANFPWVTNIGSYAFYGCAALTTANFPLVTGIGYAVFYGCTALSTVNFPQVTSIGFNAFYGCTALSTVSFPQVTSIGQAAFQGCTTLSNLMLGATPPSVADVNVFNNCPDIRSLTPVNADGVPLTNTEQTDAFARYIAENDGNTGDNLWYGWIAEPVYPITINAIDNGTVSSSHPYAPADATVTLIVTPEAGYMLQGLSCAKQGGGEAVINMDIHTFTMPAEGVTVSATFAPNVLQVTVNGSSTETGTSLENALSGVTLGEITSLTITGGAFFETDWNWLKTKRADLNALTCFTITHGVSSVADIPNTEHYNPYFGKQIKELSVAKATIIGNGAFWECTALGTASFPQVTGISDWAFQGCRALINLMLGATPPSVTDANAFMNCSGTRFLIPVNADGTPLTDQELTTALEAYDANEGQADDKLWYGWKLEEALYPITINLVGNGTVSVPQYAPVDATVTITVSPNIGYRLKEGSLRAYKTGEEGTTVTITDGKFTMPAYGVTVTCEFEMMPYTVTVAAGIANGTLAAAPNEDVTMGTEVTLTAAPATGYRLRAGSLRAYKTGDWGTTVTITGDKFTMPAHDVTVTCEFEPIQHTVSYDTPENGTLSVIANGTQVFSGDNVNVGTVLTIIATPNTGYMINSLTVNGTAFESGKTHEVVANVEIAVVFTEVTSINNVVAPTYILYPNPTNGKVTIEGSQQPVEITVYNSLGVAVHIQQLNPEETLDLGHLPDGVYIIRVNNTTTLRVVKR